MRYALGRVPLRELERSEGACFPLQLFSVRHRPLCVPAWKAARRSGARSPDGGARPALPIQRHLHARRVGQKIEKPVAEGQRRRWGRPNAGKYPKRTLAQAWDLANYHSQRQEPGAEEAPSPTRRWRGVRRGANGERAGGAGMAAPVPWRRSLTSTCRSSSPKWCSWPSIYLPLSLPAHRQPPVRRASPTSSIRNTQTQTRTEWQSCDLATAYVCASPRPRGRALAAAGTRQQRDDTRKQAAISTEAPRAA